MKKQILIAIGIFAIIQIIPYGREHSNPKVVAEPKWDSPKTKELFMRACGDCHSHNTKWPWYSSVAPVSWLVAHDVEEGRDHFNVSMWGVQKKNKGEDASEELEEGEMPPLPYLLMHKEAQLSDKEKEELIKGLEKTFGKEDEEK